MNEMEPRLLTPGELAQKLGVSRSTVFGILAAHQPPWTLVGKRKKYLYAEVVQVLPRSRTMPPLRAAVAARGMDDLLTELKARAAVLRKLK